MYKSLLVITLLCGSLFAGTKNITAKGVLDADFDLIKACNNFESQGYCDKRLMSLREFGIFKSIRQLKRDSVLWDAIVSCNNKGTGCGTVIATKEVSTSQQIKEMSLFDLLFYGLIGFGLIMWLTTFFVIVKQKTAVVIEVFGKFSSVKTAGLSLKPPFPFGKVAGTENLQIRELKIDVSVKSKDNAFLAVPVRVQYQIITEKIKEAFYELDDPEGQMKSYITNAVRSKASELDMKQLYSSKDTFEEGVKEGLSEKFKPFGYILYNVLVDDPQPTDDIVKAYNSVLVAEKEKDAAVNQAAALKIKLVGEADAEKSSLILKGQAFREYRTVMAQGHVEAIGLMRGTYEIDDSDDEESESLEPIEVTTNNNNKENKEESADFDSDTSPKEFVVPTRKIVKYKKVDNPSESALSEEAILNFFTVIDTNETLRDVGRGANNTIVVPAQNSPMNSSEIDYAKIISTIKSLESKK